MHVPSDLWWLIVVQLSIPDILSASLVCHTWRHRFRAVGTHLLRKYCPGLVHEISDQHFLVFLSVVAGLTNARPRSCDVLEARVNLWSWWYYEPRSGSIIYYPYGIPSNDKHQTVPLDKFLAEKVSGKYAFEPQRNNELWMAEQDRTSYTLHRYRIGCYPNDSFTEWKLRVFRTDSVMTLPGIFVRTVVRATTNLRSHVGPGVEAALASRVSPRCKKLQIHWIHITSEGAHIRSCISLARSTALHGSFLMRGADPIARIQPHGLEELADEEGDAEPWAHIVPKEYDYEPESVLNVVGKWSLETREEPDDEPDEVLSLRTFRNRRVQPAGQDLLAGVAKSDSGEEEFLA